MACHKILEIACLALCFGAVYGGLEHTFPSLFSLTGDRPECHPDKMTCVELTAAFGMSPVGLQLQTYTGLSPNLSQIITEDVYNRICSIAQAVESCSDAWTSKCAPPEMQAFVQLQSRAVRKILSFCNETGSYSTFTKIANCGQRTIVRSEPCANTVRDTFMSRFAADIKKLQQNSSVALLEMEESPYEFIVKRMNVQQYACCYGKQFKDCLAPVLETACTPDEKSVTENFMDRILRAYECTEDLYHC